jgi:hypothetical protein
MLATEALVSEIPEEKKPPAGGSGHAAAVTAAAWETCTKNGCQLSAFGRTKKQRCPTQAFFA